LILVLLLLVPAFFLLLLGNLKRQRSEKALARERAVTLAKLAAAHESYYIRESRQQLASMSQFPLVLMRDRAAVERGLKSLKRLQPDFADFGLVETDGKIYCHTLGTNVTQTVSSNLVQKVLKTRDFSAGTFEFENVLSLQFAYPIVRTDGRLARVMYASLKGNLLSDALTNISLGDGGVVTVFDAEGRVLARRPDPDKLVGQQSSPSPLFQKITREKEDVFEVPGLDGVDRVYARSKVADQNKPMLFVTVGIPRREAFAEADAKFGGNLVLAFLSTVLLLMAAWWYSDRIFIRPAKAIVTAADRIEKGDLKARVGLRKGKSELHRLATGFDEMAASLEKRQSELEQANQAIKSHNTQLEKHVAERTSELQLLNSELEAFSYSVSHDLRAPVRHMQGFAKILLKNPKIQEDPAMQRQLDTIVSSAKQMGMLIDDLLEFSRMGRQSLAKGKVDSTKTVNAVIAEIMGREPDRAIDWRIESLPEVHGDPALLRQVWTNLISNAVKYSRERKPAIITIFARDSAAETIFAVRDNGAGFDMAYADKLFGVFQRLHNAEEFEGTGIGLATVRRIVSRHEGRAWAEGKVGEGATFYFSIPKNHSTS
jgi:signal transduction histidine kinase